MKLAKALQIAHAIEIGAYNAYEGHWRSVKNKTIRAKIKTIQHDELDHRNQVGWMLLELNTLPTILFDFPLWCIGKTVSAACYVFGHRAAIFGAMVMEIMGSATYREIAKIARKEGYHAMAEALDLMQDKEEEHEEFFAELLERK